MDLEILCFTATDLYLSFISSSPTASSKSCRTFNLNLRVYDCLFDDSFSNVLTGTLLLLWEYYHLNWL